MTLYPGRARAAEGRWRIDDAAIQGSMAKAMEDELADLLLKTKGIPLPKQGEEDRRLLFVAISRGVLRYLAEREQSIRVEARVNGVGVSTNVDLRVDMEGGGP